MTKVSTIAVERIDNAHEVAYVMTIKYGNRMINEDQREAMAKLVRRVSREVAVFAELIAGANQIKEASLRRVSSAEGNQQIEMFSENIE